MPRSTVTTSSLLLGIGVTALVVFATPRSAAAQVQAESLVVVVIPPLSPPGLEITNVRADGYITLADRSSWAPDLEDRPITVTWERDDFVVVKRIPAPRGDYDFWLINATRADTAAMRFAGRARSEWRPSDDAPDDAPEE